MDKLLHITESELSKIVSDAVNKARDLSNSHFRNMVMNIGRAMERRNVNTIYEPCDDEDYGCGVSYDNGCGSSKRSYGGGCGASYSDYGCGSSSSRNGC
jgi:hypothetical protein